MTFSIRKLERSDLGSYKAIRHRAFQESFHAFSESFEDEKQKGDDFFAAVMGFESEHFTLGGFSAGDQLEAITTFKRDQRSKARHKGYIHTMYVAPETRGNGMAKALLEKLVAGAREQTGLEQVHLWVLNPETSPAKKLYIKSGFLVQGTMVKKDLKMGEKYVDAEYMILDFLKEG